MYVEEETFAEATEVPWHLDMLDGNCHELDGLFTSIGSGEGVDIYILDTGTIILIASLKFIAIQLINELGNR